jgi:fission process protein 1
VFETAGTPADRGAWESLTAPLQALLAGIDYSEPSSFDGEEKSEYDPLRDGPLRYLGYANELGEAFAAWLFSGGVPLSYAVAIGYVLFDTVDKYKRTLKEAQAKLSARSLPADVDVDALVNVIAAERGLDTLVWQLIASVAAPGYTIHSVVAATRWAVAGVEAQPQVAAALAGAAAAVGAAPDVFIEALNKSVPTASGLLAIPFIVHPIDGAVHAALNATLRPAMRRYICSQAGGGKAGLAICQDCQQP